MVYFPPQQNNKNGINLRFLSGEDGEGGENPSTPSWTTLQEEEKKGEKKSYRV